MRRLSWLLALLPLAVACGATAPAPPATVEVAAAPPPAPPPAPAPAPALDAVCERGTAHLLGALKSRLRVTVWVTRGTPKLDAFAATLDALFTGYERLAPGKIAHRLIEAKSPEEMRAAKDAGLQDAVFGDGEAVTTELRHGFLGILFEYGSEKEVLPILSPEQTKGLAFWVANKIREVHDRADGTPRRVGVLTGKDEVSISEANLVPSRGSGAGPNLRGVMAQALPFYKLEDVDLRGGQAEIGGDLIGLIITQPGKDFTEKELRRIDQFLMRGKAVAVFAGAVNLKPSDATMTAELDTHGLEKLLDGYGVELTRDAIFDWGHPAGVKVATQGTPVNFASAAVMLATHDPAAAPAVQPLDQTFAGFFRLDELVFPFPSTLVLHADRQPGATLRVLARTSPRSTAVTTRTLSLKPARDVKPQGALSQRAVAAALEGKIRSAFAGREDPAIPAPAESRDPGRLLVVSSPQFLANPWARAGNPPPMPPQMAMMGPMGGDEDLMLLSQPYAQQYLTSTILAFKNTLDWMAADDDLIACSAILAAK